MASETLPPKEMIKESMLWKMVIGPKGGVSRHNKPWVDIVGGIGIFLAFLIFAWLLFTAF